MSAPLSSYRPSRIYLWAGAIAVILGIAMAWLALHFPLAGIASALFLVSATFFIYLAGRPEIEVYESHLRVGGRAVPWLQVRRVDRSLSTPLVLRLTLADKGRLLIVYSGDPSSGESLLRFVRRLSREALIDGVPYRQFWGDPVTPVVERKQLPPPRYPLLMAEDEAEVERLFQRLKSVGHLDQRSSSEDK